MKPNKVTGDTSDGYHTFNELYEHRALLFIMLAKQNYGKAWRAKLHEDGTMYDGYFIAGIHTPEGDITYHLEEKYWNDMNGMVTLTYADKYDGHTSQDVAKRLRRWNQKI